MTHLATEYSETNKIATPLRRAAVSEKINNSLWRLAEEETLLLMRKYSLTATEIIRQYTGKSPDIADMSDAIDAVYSFNISSANRNGFVVY